MPVWSIQSTSKPVPVKRNSAPFSRHYSFLTASTFLVLERTNYFLELFISWRISANCRNTGRQPWHSHPQLSLCIGHFEETARTVKSPKKFPTPHPGQIFCTVFISLLLWVKAVNITLTLFTPNLPISNPSRRRRGCQCFCCLFRTSPCPVLPSATRGALRRRQYAWRWEHQFFSLKKTDWSFRCWPVLIEEFPIFRQSFPCYFTYPK